ncbi:MAG: hypothetical protein WBG66_19345 [Geitlerinemataceae cyanobacterium]
MGLKPPTPNPKPQMTKDRRQKTNNKRRSFICSIAALASGLLGFGVGGFLSTSGQLQVCQTRPWGMEQLCSTLATPGAFLRGGITGLWVGTILGAFSAGVATHQSVSKSIDSEEEREMSWSQIQAWIEAAARLEPQESISLTEEETYELLEQLGFSQAAIDRSRLPKREEEAEIEPRG